MQLWYNHHFFFAKNPLKRNNNWSVLKLKISHWSCQNYQVFVQKVSLTAYLWTSLERAEHVNLKVLLCFYTLKASRSKKYYFFDVAAKKEDMVMINEWSREEVGYIWSCAKKDKNQKTHKYICWGINCRPPLLLLHPLWKSVSICPSIRTFFCPTLMENIKCWQQARISVLPYGYCDSQERRARTKTNTKSNSREPKTENGLIKDGGYRIANG